MRCLAVSILFLSSFCEALDLEIALTSDINKIVRGGLEQTTNVLGNLDLTAAHAFQGIGNKKAKAFVYLLGNLGDDPSQHVGDAQGSSNIEAPDTIKVYEAWLQHELSPHATFTFGLHDYNSVFYALDSTELFIHSSFGIGPDTSQTGPSIFPTTALGAIFQFEFGRSSLSVASYDGQPGDPDNEKGTHIRYSKEEGLFNALEYSLHANERGLWRVASGLWQHTQERENDITSEIITNNTGLYLIGERKFSQVTTFFQLGHANPKRNEIENYIGLGASKNTVFFTDDEIGLAIAQARPSKNTQHAHQNETVVELSYRVALAEIQIQPDLQYVINPGFNQDIDDAVILGVRIGWSHAF